MQNSILTGKEILERLEVFFENNNGGVDSYAYGNFNEEELGLGKIEVVDLYGGEGQGERWWRTRYFVDHDVYIKTIGYYSSYNGTDFDYGYGEEVRPVQKTITVFE